jgi:hypothetical protein
MTRRKEIEKAAFNYINSDAVSPENMQLAFGDFINGAQWADKTMIERVEQWLIKNNRGQTISSLHRFLEEE